MSDARYEWPTASDLALFAADRSDTPLHCTAVAIFEAGALLEPQGRIDVARIREAVAAALPDLPRWRSRWSRVPLEGSHVWLPDPDVDLGFHVRHTRLPAPGDERELRALVGWVAAQRLDRRRPLWELWVIEGLADDRFALVLKHAAALITEPGGPDLLARLLAGSPESSAASEDTEDADGDAGEAATGSLELLGDALIQRALAPFAWAESALEVAAAPLDTASRWLDQALGYLPGTAQATGPLAAAPGRRRAADWLVTSFDDVRLIADKFGTDADDVLLAVVTGALRLLLERRELQVSDLELVAALPTLRIEGDEPRIDVLQVELPIEEGDGLVRLARLIGASESRRETGEAAFGRQPATGLCALSRWASALREQVEDGREDIALFAAPGPDTAPLWLGARLEALYGLPPLLAGQSLSISATRIGNGICWGVFADPDGAPDLDLFVDALASALRELLAEARPSAVASE